jgi:CHAT domain
MTTEYLDFEIEVSGVEGHYIVHLIRSPSGEAEAPLDFPCSTSELRERVIAAHDTITRSKIAHRRLASPEERSIQSLGSDLFNGLIAGLVRRCFDLSCGEAERQEKGLRLKLRMRSPELANFPWEFMYDSRDGTFLSRSTNRPIVRYPEIGDAARPLSVSLPLRILGMVAAPSDLPTLDVNREKRLIENAVQELKRRGLVDIEWVENGTIDGLKQALRHNPQMLHFIGHGNFDRNLDEGVLAFEDENGATRSVPASQLADILGDQLSLRLVVLNSCEGARGGETDLFSSTAATLVRRPNSGRCSYAIRNFRRGCRSVCSRLLPRPVSRGPD